MTYLEWNKDNLGTKLSKTFLRGLLDNCERVIGDDRAKIRVQFGITGTGAQPNYQITYRRTGKPDKTLAFRGNTHSQYGLSEPFNEERVSQEEITYADIKAAYSA